MRRSFFLSPEGAFATVALVFGIATCLALPPLQGIDEFSHFFRVYQLAGFDLFCHRENGEVGDLLPKSLMATMNKVDGWGAWHPERAVRWTLVQEGFDIPLLPDDTEFRTVSAQFYTPISYLPQIVAMVIMRPLEVRPMVMLYVGRFFAMTGGIILIFLAIRTTPMMKWFFAFLGLSPMILFIRSSYSGDNMSISLCFLYVAVVLQTALSNEVRLTNRRATLITTLAVLCCLAKPPNAALVMLFLVIPLPKAAHRRQYLRFFALHALIPLLFLFAWWYLNKDLTASHGVGGAPVSARAQIQHILEHPREFLEIVVNTYRGTIWRYLEYFTGPVFFAHVFDVAWFKPLAVFFVAVAAALALAESYSDVSVALWQRCMSVLTAIPGLVLIAVLAYAMWNEVGAPSIKELFPRYYIVYAPLVFVPLYNHVLTRAGAWIPALFYPAASFVGVVTQLVLVGRWDFAA